MQEAAEHQQIRSWMLHHLHNMPVEKSRDTIGQFLFEAICSKTDHADKVAKIAGMLLMCYHGVAVITGVSTVTVNPPFSQGSS